MRIRFIVHYKKISPNNTTRDDTIELFYFPTFLLPNSTMSLFDHYKKEFQITEKKWNNIFCFDEIDNPIIHIPNLIQWNVSDIQAGSNIVFHEKNKDSIQYYTGLKNFVEITQWEQKIYIIDNHNHALYFWYKEFFAWNIEKGANLLHIDQHTDMNSIHLKSKFFEKELSLDDIFEITNYHCNVWNFISPAIQLWLVKNIQQINTEYSLLNIDSTKEIDILDIDLDFWHPNMSIEKHNKTVKTVKDLISKSRVVTIATSPYFLDQKFAFEIISQIL